MTFRKWMLSLAAAGLLAGSGPAHADDDKPVREPASLLTYRTPSLATARDQALQWLQGTGKNDEATQQAFRDIWDAADRPLLDRVADTLALGDADAAKLLAQVRNTTLPAPTQVPDRLRDRKLPTFFRANLALAYAQALSQRRVFEEALDTLRVIKPSDVVDPAAYFFHRAVAEYSLRKQPEAHRSIVQLGDVADAPERYQAVTALMETQMRGWQQRDLAWVAGTMDNIERRLDLGRGGRETKKLQRDVIKALDDLIRRLELPPPPPRPPEPPVPGEPRPVPPPPPQGQANNDFIRRYGWMNKLPEKERVAAMVELIRGLPVANREQMEKYVRRINEVPR